MSCYVPLFLLLFSFLGISLTYADNISHRSYNEAEGAEFDRLYNEAKEAVEKLADKIQDNFKDICSSADGCSNRPCMPHGCAASGFGDNYKCSGLVPLVNQAERCIGQCANKSLLSFEEPFFYSLVDSAEYKNSTSDKIVLKGEKLIQEACTFKKMSGIFRDTYSTFNLKSWLYVGTVHGSYSIFPGAARDYTSREKSLEKCGFNPSERPWFTTAISGPKNVIFLFDRNIIRNNNANILQGALKNSINILDRRDNVSVISFHKSVNVLNSPDTFQPATNAVKEKLKEEVELLEEPAAAESTNILLAFREAFDLLTSHSKATTTGDCSNIIVLLLGSRPSCSEVCDGADCQCTSEIIKSINKYQEDFQGHVSIVSFTEFHSGTTPYDEDRNKAERVARSIVCEGNRPGLWKAVGPHDTEENATLVLSQFAAISRHEDDVGTFASEKYTDSLGQGEMFTIARPVFVDQRLVAVAATDITLKHAIDMVGSKSTVDKKIESHSKEVRKCRFKPRSSCEMQAMRRGNAGDISGECADNLQQYKCYQIGGNVFLHEEDLKTWDEALTACKRLGNNSSLARVHTRVRNKELSGIFSYDGSWIGLRAKKNEDLKWTDGEVANTSLHGFPSNSTGAVKSLHEEKEEDACVSADRRGIEANWNIVPCNERLGYICEFPSAGTINACNGNMFTSSMQKERFPDDPVNQRKGEHNVNCLASSQQNTGKCDVDLFANADPFCEDGEESYEYKDRFCCGGKADSDISSTCLEKKAAIRKGSTSVGFIVLGVMAPLLLILLVLLALRFLYRRKGKRKEDIAQMQPGANIVSRERPIPSSSFPTGGHPLDIGDISSGESEDPQPGDNWFL